MSERTGGACTAGDGSALASRRRLPVRRRESHREYRRPVPVGQLDGGHIVRAIVGQRQETIAAAVPGGLFALAGALYFTQEAPPIGFGVWTLWVFWGLLSTGLAYAGPANPTIDEDLDPTRTALGVVTFLLGLACFTPIPFEIVAA